MRYSLRCVWEYTGWYEDIDFEASSRAAARRLAERAGLKVMGDEHVPAKAGGRSEGGRPGIVNPLDRPSVCKRDSR